jgi:hypothetical protein
MAAEDDQVLHVAEFVRRVLVEHRGIRSCEDDFVIIPLRCKMSEGILNGLYGHDHSGLTTKGVIIYAPVFAFREIPERVDMDFHQAPFPCTFHNGVVKRP